jgi:hypothetical protein
MPTSMVKDYIRSVSLSWALTLKLRSVLLDQPTIKRRKSPVFSGTASQALFINVKTIPYLGRNSVILSFICYCNSQSMYTVILYAC